MSTKTEILVGLAEVYGEDLTGPRLKAYLLVLKQIPTEEVLRAANQILASENTRKMPLPGQLLAICQPTLTAEEEAKEVAGRIIAAVPRYGYANQDEAKKYIGELGWQVVAMQGGWAEICRNMRNHMIPTLQAQYRELALTLRKKAIIGNLDTPPALPGRQTKALESAGSVLKQLPSLKELE